MRVEYAPAVKRILREQRMRQVYALAKRLGMTVAFVAFVLYWTAA